MAVNHSIVIPVDCKELDVVLEKAKQLKLLLEENKVLISEAEEKREKERSDRPTWRDVLSKQVLMMARASEDACAEDLCALSKTILSYSELDLWYEST